MEYTYNYQIPARVNQCIDDAREQGFKYIVIEVNTLYKQVYYRTFCNVASASHYVMYSNDITYKHICLVQDHNSYEYAAHWSYKII